MKKKNISKIRIKLKKRNPLVEIIMKKGTKKHKNKKKESKDDGMDWFKVGETD
jgi:hypothetical protein